MKRPLIGVVVCITALSNGLPFREVAVQVDGEFSKDTSPSGSVVLQGGPFSLSALRDDKGKLGFGAGLDEAVQIVSLGSLGKLTIKATTTLDGLFDAILDTEILQGSRAFNPLTMSLVKNAKGMDYAGATDLGYAGGSLQGSTNPAVIPRFEVHLNSDGWITGQMMGAIRNKKIEISSYTGGVNLGLIAAVATLDSEKKLQKYELSSSLGILHGSMITNAANKNSKSYRAGISLGILTFDVLIDENQSRSYTTQVDSGIVKVKLNIDPNNAATLKGSIDLANLGFDVEQNLQQTKIGGRIQIGSSVLVAHRICDNIKTGDSTESACKFTMKVNEGMVIG